MWGCGMVMGRWGGGWGEGVGDRGVGDGWEGAVRWVVTAVVGGGVGCDSSAVVTGRPRRQ